MAAKNMSRAYADDGMSYFVYCESNGGKIFSRQEFAASKVLMPGLKKRRNAFNLTMALPKIQLSTSKQVTSVKPFLKEHGLAIIALMMLGIAVVFLVGNLPNMVIGWATWTPALQFARSLPWLQIIGFLTLGLGLVFVWVRLKDNLTKALFTAVIIVGGLALSSFNHPSTITQVTQPAVAAVTVVVENTPLPTATPDAQSITAEMPDANAVQDIAEVGAGGELDWFVTSFNKSVNAFNGSIRKLLDSGKDLVIWQDFLFGDANGGVGLQAAYQTHYDWANTRVLQKGNWVEKSYPQRLKEQLTDPTVITQLSSGANQENQCLKTLLDLVTTLKDLKDPKASGWDNAKGQAEQFSLCVSAYNLWAGKRGSTVFMTDLTPNAVQILQDLSAPGSQDVTATPMNTPVVDVQRLVVAAGLNDATAITTATLVAPTDVPADTATELPPTATPVPTLDIVIETYPDTPREYVAPDVQPQDQAPQPAGLALAQEPNVLTDDNPQATAVPVTVVPADPCTNCTNKGRAPSWQSLLATYESSNLDWNTQYESTEGHRHTWYFWVPYGDSFALIVNVVLNTERQRVDWYQVPSVPTQFAATIEFVCSDADQGTCNNPQPAIP